MSKAGAHCQLPAASAWLSVWPVPHWLGIYVHEVAESQSSCSRDFTQALLSTHLKPGCHLGDTGGCSAPIACGSPAVLEVLGCWQPVPVYAEEALQPLLTL